MQINETIGIDVSKNVIDVCIHTVKLIEQFDNNNSGFSKLLKWVLKNTVYTLNETFFVFEHTGMYSDSLADYLNKKELNFSIISGLEIKRSLGLTRGKEDKVDAKRIALYAFRLREELVVSKILNSDLKQLKPMFSLRKKLVKQRSGYKATLKEQKRVYSKKEYKLIFEIQEKVIREFDKQIKKLEKEMREIILKNKELKSNFDLLNSIKGIGEKTAITMLIYTSNFTKFENSRKFASYCGVAPFPYLSGSSIRGRSKVSHLANKGIKSILNMCAINAIQYNSEIKAFYERRIKKGKSKMSTINIIRNKLISRMFAVINRQTPYVDTMKFVA